MVNYEKGKIYKLVNEEMGLTYYGSTCQKYLSNRLTSHIYYANHNVNITSKKLFEKGSVKIYLVELFPCGSKDELHARERYYIETNECVNITHPGRTSSEWKKDNKETHNSTNLKSYHKNKELINEKRLKKMICICGSEHSIAGKSKHLKTVKHLSFLK